MRNNFTPDYFTYGELTVTHTGLNNQPSLFSQLEQIVKLGHGLDYIRTEFGYPIIVNSAFRTQEVNKAVGGSVNSYHLFGLAADIRPSDPDLFLSLVGRLNFMNEDGIFLEYIKYMNKGFVHIAFDPSFLDERFAKLMENRYGY